MRRQVMLLLYCGTLVGCQPEDDAKSNDPIEAGCPWGLDANEDGVCDGDLVDWSAGATIPEGDNRANIYNLAPDDWAQVRRDGLQHVFVWPIDITGVLIPYRPFDDFARDPSNAGAVDLMRQQIGFGNFEEFYTWLGLARFPEPGETGIYDIPIPAGQAPGDAVGAAIIDSAWGEGLTFSCATCHTGTLFGKTVVGMTNRRARANAVFLLAAEIIHSFPPDAFQSFLGATDEERALYERTIEHYGAIGAKEPEVLGLDTAVAQIGLSLGRRAPDPIASYSAEYESHPAYTELETYVADSKPAVWWTLKYKTKWLSDGALVSGNPIVYNLLANELGRGTDLVELEDWLVHEQKVLDELTVAVFATEPPRWTDFFAPTSIDEAAAMRGEARFADLCAGCHGSYEKGWSADDAGTRSAAERLATVQVRYHSQTPVMDVGTDAQRRLGGDIYIDHLNQLSILEHAGSTFAGQGGYVPPPLDGIWARYPYLHNNSVPTLCDLLSPPEARPTVFVQGPADDPSTDFDAACVGYPTGDAIPEGWWEDEAAVFDATVDGLRNIGHDEMLRDESGAWLLSDSDRADLVEFLKTL